MRDDAATLTFAPPPAAAPTASPVARCAVVVVHYRGLADTLACLRSLAEHAPAAPVVVVDNASPDGSGRELAAHLRGTPGVELLVSPRNGGFGAGCNLAFARLVAGRPGLTHVLLLNPDARLTAGALPAMLAAAARHPGAGAVGCRITDEQDRTWFENGRVPRWTLSGFHAPAPKGALEHPTGFVTGCAMLLDARLVRAGLRFDEGYFLYGEDADLCARIVGAGRELWVTQAATVIHRGGGSQSGPQLLPGMTRDQIYWITRSKVRYARRHLRWWERWAFAAVALVAKPLAGLVIARSTAFLRPYAAGLRDGLRADRGPRRGDGPNAI